MADPFQDKFKGIIEDYKKGSEFSYKYESWTLRSLIVKANDDLRQEVLALQLMKRL